MAERTEVMVIDMAEISAEWNSHGPMEQAVPDEPTYRSLKKCLLSGPVYFMLKLNQKSRDEAGVCIIRNKGWVSFSVDDP